MSTAPGDGRYAHVEHEQRWLLSAVPPGLTAPVSIVDRYLSGTTLRLRRAEDASGAATFKLGQKVRTRSGSPEVVHLTNLYLRSDEHALLATLPADELRKVRWHLEVDSRRYCIDVFDGPHAGLVLAELELVPGESRVRPPPWVTTEVTDDDRYSGGSLAALTAEEAAVLARP